MAYIYVLKLEDNKYYVGKTINPTFQMENHFNEKDSAWTKKYKPIKVEALISDCDSYDEDKYTRKYMDKYGIENVRGGSFVTIDLGETILQYLNQMNKKCFRCGLNGHYAYNCCAKTDVKGNYICDDEGYPGYTYDDDNSSNEYY